MSEIVKCAKCGNEIGREYYIDDIIFLDCGGAIVRQMQGNCKQCGSAFVFATSDLRLERLIKRVLERKKVA